MRRSFQNRLQSLVLDNYVFEVGVRQANLVCNFSRKCLALIAISIVDLSKGFKYVVFECLDLHFNLPSIDVLCRDA